VIPQASSESLRAALGDPPSITVPVNHVWLLGNPDAFAEVMTSIVGLAPAV
jgi:hypothetical protein